MVTQVKFYLQEGQSQRIPCKSFKKYDDIVSSMWFKYSSLDRGDETKKLVLRSAGTFSADITRYRFASDFSMVITGVEKKDGGLYLCQKVAFKESDHMENTVEVVILDKLFPSVNQLLTGSWDVTWKTNQETAVSCPVMEAYTFRDPTVYWSTYNGYPMNQTLIIAARFSDGETMTLDTFSISANNSLILPMTPSSMEYKVFLCHVSSTVDDFNLHSAYVSLKTEDTPEDTNVAGVVLPLLFVFLALLAVLLMYKYRKTI